ADLSAGLTPVERLALAGDQWALVRGGRAPIESFLDLADALGEETDYDVLDGIAGPLDLIDEQVAEPGSAVQAGFRAWIARRFGPQLERLRWAAAPGEDDPTRLRRAALVRLLGGVAEVPAVLAGARRRLGLGRGSPPPLLARLVEVTRAPAAPGYARDVGRFVRTPPVPEARRAVKQALEVFRLNAALRRRTAPGLARWLGSRS